MVSAIAETISFFDRKPLYKTDLTPMLCNY